MDKITADLQLLTTLFGVVATLAILAAGFFLGRHWLRKVDGASGPDASSREMYQYWRENGQTPADMQRMRGNGGWRQL